MENIVTQGMLYDFYGELLTEHQRRIYEDLVYQDMSLSEIAEEFCISRQGVHDQIRRCDRILQEYEEKLHLVQKFANAKDVLSQMENLAKDSETLDEEGCRRNMAKMRELASGLLHNF